MVCAHPEQPPSCVETLAARVAGFWDLQRRLLCAQACIEGLFRAVWCQNLERCWCYVSTFLWQLPTPSQVLVELHFPLAAQPGTGAWTNQ